MQHDVEVDARGLRCPMPVLKTWRILKAAATGQVMKVVATDRGSTLDFPAFLSRTPHLLLGTAEAQGEYVYFIQKV